ncbi:chemotaxis protein CheW [Bosea sp. 2RAB26]|uniref:chemotaxis protein CheW n=1 Tax=Bosea sp. 2RAB26 TaxID=3237476 RepID=UPI003F93CB38
MSVTAGMQATEQGQGINECWRQIGVSGDRSCPELREHLHCRNCPTHAEIARSLLDRPLPAGYSEEWAQHFARAAERPEAEGGARSVVLFRLGEEWLGLPTTTCHEIAEPRRIHSLPHRRTGAVLGIVNVRGELLICMSLPELLGINTGGQSSGGGKIAVFRRLIVIGRDERRVAFEVDEVHGMHSYGERDLIAVPATIGKSASTVILAMLSWHGRTVGCLDEAPLLAMIDRSIA